MCFKTDRLKKYCLSSEIGGLEVEKPWIFMHLCKLQWEIHSNLGKIQGFSTSRTPIFKKCYRNEHDTEHRHKGLPQSVPGSKFVSGGVATHHRASVSLSQKFAVCAAFVIQQ